MEENSTRNILRTVTAVCFCVFVLLMSIINLKLAGRPAVSFLTGELSFKEMTQEIADNYVSAKLWMRSDFINFNGLFARVSGRRAFNQTIRMENDMLNYGYSTFSDPPDETLEINLSDSIGSFADYMETLDIPFYFVLAPVKEDLEGELLPDAFQNYQNQTGDHLLELLSEKEIDVYIKEYFPFINLDFCNFVVDKDDNLIAFGLSIPCLGPAYKKANGRLFPFGWFHLLRALHKYDSIDLLLNGVHPEWQKRGVHSIYYAEMNRNAIKNNVIWAYTNPQIIGNEAEKIWGTTYQTEPLMTRAVFGKEI